MAIVATAWANRKKEAGREWILDGGLALESVHLTGRWWCTLLIPALGRQRQVDFRVQGQPGLQSEFQDSQGYTEKPCLYREPKPGAIQKNKTTKKVHSGWRDGSAVKSTDCSFRGLEFNSQQPHGGSQPPIMRSDVLFWGV